VLMNVMGFLGFQSSCSVCCLVSLCVSVGISVGISVGVCLCYV